MSGLPPPGIGQVAWSGAGVGVEHGDGAGVPVGHVQPGWRPGTGRARACRARWGSRAAPWWRRRRAPRARPGRGRRCRTPSRPGASLMSCGPIRVFRTGMSIIRSRRCVATSTTATRPANSQVNTAVRPSGVKSAWSTPRQSGTGQHVLHLPAVRVVEHQLAAALGHRDRRAAVRGEVQVVRVGDREARAGLAGARVERGERVAQVVAGVERGQVVGRDHVLQLAAQLVPPDHGERRRVDHPDVTRLGVRHVHQRAWPPGPARRASRRRRPRTRCAGR